MDNLPERRFNSTKLAKARIHTWLAWQEEPGKPFGIALKSKYLDPAAPAAQAFIDWIRRVGEKGRMED